MQHQHRERALQTIPAPADKIDSPPKGLSVIVLIDSVFALMKHNTGLQSLETLD
jgi:hypothetical protein